MTQPPEFWIAQHPPTRRDERNTHTTHVSNTRGG